jgi:hypothetical protein
VRAQLEEELAAVGPAALHRRLAELDPKAAAATLPSNGRRVVRALEVLELTETRFSDGPGMTAYRSIYPGLRLVGLELDHAALVERIVRRVDLMWQQGLVDEVRRLEKTGLRDGVTARRALGYQQVLAMLAGEYDDATARERRSTPPGASPGGRCRGSGATRGSPGCQPTATRCRARWLSCPRTSARRAPTGRATGSTYRSMSRVPRNARSRSTCCSQASQTFSRSGVCSLGLFHTTACTASARQPFAEQRSSPVVASMPGSLAGVDPFG